VQKTLQGAYEQSLKKGYIRADDIDKLDAVKSMDENTDIFVSKWSASGGVKSKKQQLAELRDLEWRIDQMKQHKGYRGEPRIDHTEQTQPVPKKQVTPAQSQGQAPVPQQPPMVPKEFVQDDVFAQSPAGAMYPPKVPASQIPDQKQAPTDAFGTAISKPQLSVADTIIRGSATKTSPADATSSMDYMGRTNNNLPVKPKGQSRQEYFDQYMPSIIDRQNNLQKKQKEISDPNSKAVRDFYSSNPSPEAVAAFEKQRKSALEDVGKQAAEIDTRFGNDISEYKFRKRAQGIAQNSFGIDPKDPNNVIIGSQLANISQLDSNFYATFHDIVKREKKAGKIEQHLTDQEVLDGILGSALPLRTLFAGTKYQELRNKYEGFFDAYEGTRDKLNILDNEYRRSGGYKNAQEFEVPDIQEGGGQGKPVSGPRNTVKKGVKIPLNEISWSGAEGATRAASDIGQSIERGTVDGFTPLIAGAVGLIPGVGYEGERSTKQAIEALGSSLIKPFTGGGWSSVKDLLNLNIYKTPTASEVYAATTGLGGANAEEMEKRADSPLRDITQGVANSVTSLLFGDLAVEGAVTAKGLQAGRAAMASKGWFKSAEMAERILQAEQTAAKIGKAGTMQELIMGTAEGRKSIAMAKALLPPELAKDINEAAHLALTLGLNHVVRHADNLRNEDIVEGIKDGSLFALTNYGFGKAFGTVGQRLAVAKAAGLEMEEAATMLNSYQRGSAILSQMASGPATTHISDALEKGDVSKLWDSGDKDMRRSIIDMFMGVVGLKDYFGEVGAIHGKAKEAKAIYEQTLNDIVDGTKKIDDAYTELHNFAEEQETAKTGKEQDPYYNRVYDALKDNPDALEAFAKREAEKTNERFDARNGRITEGKIDKEYHDKMLEALKNHPDLADRFITDELQHLADVKLEARPKDFTPIEASEQASKEEVQADEDGMFFWHGNEKIRVPSEFEQKLSESVAKFERDENYRDISWKPKTGEPAIKKEQLIDIDNLEIPDSERPSYELHNYLTDKQVVPVKELHAKLTETETDPLNQRLLKLFEKADLSGSALMSNDVKGADGVQIPAYSIGKDIVFSKETDVYGDRILYPGHTRQIAIHEMFHTASSRAIESNREFRNSLEHLLNQVRDHEAFSGLMDEVKAYHLGTPGGHQQFGHDNSHINEFAAGIADSRTGIREALQNIMVDSKGNLAVEGTKGKLRTAWEWVKSLFVKGLGARGETRTALEHFMDIMERTDLKPSSRVKGPQLGAMRFVAEAVGGKEMKDEYYQSPEVKRGIDIITKALSEVADYNGMRVNPDNLLNDVIANTEKANSAALEGAIAETEARKGGDDGGKALVDAIHQSGIMHDLDTMGATEAAKAGETFASLPPQKKIAHIANALLKREDITLRPGNKFALSVLAAKDGDDNDNFEGELLPKSIYQEGLNVSDSKTARQILRANVANGFEAFSKHVDETVYGISSLLKGEQAETFKRDLETFKRKEYYGAHNTRPIQSIGIHFDKDPNGTITGVEAYPLGRKTNLGTETRTAKQATTGLDTIFADMLQSQKSNPENANPAIQAAFDVFNPDMKIMTVMELRKPVKMSNRNLMEEEEMALGYRQEEERRFTYGKFSVDNGKDLANIQRHMYINQGYVFAEGGKIVIDASAYKAVTQGTPVERDAMIRDMENAHVWNWLDSAETMKDGRAPGRFGTLPSKIDLMKLHALVNASDPALRKDLNEINLQDILKDEVLRTGKYTYQGKVYDIAPDIKAFAEKKQLLVPTYKLLADKLKAFYTDHHGAEVLPFTLQPDSYKSKGARRDLEFLRQFNNILSRATDNGGKELQTDRKPGKNLRKYNKILVSEGIKYKTNKDAMDILGEKYAGMDDNELLANHLVHRDSNGDMYFKVAVMNADALAELDEHTAKFVKAETDGGGFFFSEGTREFIKDLHVQKGDISTFKVSAYENGAFLKNEFSFIGTEYMERMSMEHPDVAPTLERHIAMAQSLKNQGIAFVAPNTALKGNVKVPFKVGDVILNAQREVVGVQQGDKIDTKKETLDKLNQDGTMAILSGGEVPDYSIIKIYVSGKKAYGFVQSVAATERTVSPGLGGLNHPLNMPVSKEGETIYPEVKFFRTNLINDAMQVSEGYPYLIEEFGKIATANRMGTTVHQAPEDYKLQAIGRFLKKYSRYLKSQASDEFSPITLEMAKTLESAVGEGDKAIYSRLGAIALFSELFEPEAQTIISFLKTVWDKPYGTKGLGATVRVAPNIGTALADAYNLLGYQGDKYFDLLTRRMFEPNYAEWFDYQWRKYFRKKRMPEDREDAARLIANEAYKRSVAYFEKNIKPFHLQPDGKLSEPTPKNPLGGRGVILSKAEFENINTERRRQGLRPLRMGDRIVVIATPSDSMDTSMFPGVIVGITDAANRITLPTGWTVVYTGKDFDGDTLGFMVGSKEWIDQETGEDKFELFHEKLITLGFHRADIKQREEQDALIKAASEVNKIGGSKLNDMITLADGGHPRVDRILHHADLRHIEQQMQSYADISPAIEYMNSISAALWNSFAAGEMKPQQDGTWRTYTRSGLEIVWSPELARNYSVTKQLHNVDMFMKQTVNRDDMYYGPWIRSFSPDGTLGVLWSKMEDLDRSGSGRLRKAAIKAFEEWVDKRSPLRISKTGLGLNKGTKDFVKLFEQHLKVLGTNPNANHYTNLLMATQGSLNEPATFKAQDKASTNVLTEIKNQAVESAQAYISSEDREKATQVLKDCSYALLPLFVRPSYEAQKSGHGYFDVLKDKLGFYLVRTVNGEKRPQKEYVRVSMLTNYRHAVLSSPVIPSRQQPIKGMPNWSCGADSKGQYVQYQDKGKQYIKDIITPEGTLSQDFMAFIDGMGFGRKLQGPGLSDGQYASFAGRVLFEPEVMRMIRPSALDGKETRSLLGTSIANIAKAIENSSPNAPSANFIAGTLLLTEFPKPPIGAFPYTGPALAPKGSEKEKGIIIDEQDGTYTTDPMKVLRATEANGVMATASGVPVGNLLQINAREVSAAVEPEKPDQLGALRLFSKTKEKRAVIALFKEMGFDQLDVFDADVVEKVLDKVKKDFKKRYGMQIGEAELEDALADLTPDAYLNYFNAMDSIQTRLEAQKYIIANITLLDKALAEYATAIKDKNLTAKTLKGIWKHITPFSDNSRTGLINTFSTDRQYYPADYVIAPVPGYVDGKVQTVHEYKVEHIIDPETTMFDSSSLQSRAFIDFVVPSSVHSDFVNFTSFHIDEATKIAEMMEETPRNYTALVHAMQSNELLMAEPEIDGITNGITKMNASIRVAGRSINTDESSFTSSLIDAVDSIPIGSIFEKITSGEKKDYRYKRNYVTNADFQNRRVFFTGVAPEKNYKSAFSSELEHVQGEAFIMARHRANIMNEPLYLKDIPSGKWYLKSPGNDNDITELPDMSEHADAVKQFIANGQYHLSSKLEDVFTDQEYHDRVMEDFGIYGEGINPFDSYTQLPDIVEEEVLPASKTTTESEAGIKQALASVLHVGAINKMASMALQISNAHIRAMVSSRPMDAAAKDLARSVIEHNNDIVSKLEDKTYRGIISSMSSVNHGNVMEAYETIDDLLFEMQSKPDPNNPEAFNKELYLTGLANALVPHYNEITSAEKFSAMKEIERAIYRAHNDLSRRMGETKYDVFGTSKNKDLKGKETYTTEDILTAMGRTDLVEISAKNAIENLKRLMEQTLRHYDQIALSSYYLTPEENAIAHTNIVEALSHLKKGFIQEINNDVGQWELEYHKRQVGGDDSSYFPIAAGTIVNVQFVDDFGDSRVIHGVMGGIMSGDVETIGYDTDQKKATSTMSKQPLMLVADHDARKISMVPLDRLQKVRSIVHHTDSKKYDKFKRMVESDPEIQNLAKSILPKKIVSGGEDNAREEYAKPNRFQTTSYIQALRVADDATTQRLKRIGMNYAVLDSYMHIGDLVKATVKAGAVFGGVMATGGAGAILPAALAALGIFAVGVGRMAGKSIGTIAENYMSIPSAETTLKNKFWWNQAYVAARSVFKPKTILNAENKITAKVAFRQTFEHGGMGNVTHEFSEQYGAGEHSVDATPMKAIKGQELRSAMKKTKKVLEKAGITNYSYKDLSDEALSLGIKNLHELGIKAYMMNGEIIVTHEGKEFNDVERATVSILGGIAWISSLGVLTATEADTAEKTAGFNTGFAEKELSGVRKDPVKLASLVKTLNMLSLGAHSDASADTKDGWLKLQTVYQKFRLRKSVNRTKGAMEIAGVIDVINEVFGTTVVRELNYGGRTSSDPYKSFGISALNSVLSPKLIWATFETIITAMGFDAASTHRYPNTFLPGWRTGEQKATSALRADENVIGAMMRTILTEISAGKPKTKDQAVDKQMRFSKDLREVLQPIPTGMGTSAVVGSIILAGETANHLVNSGLNSNLHKEGLTELAAGTAASLLKTNPYTSLASPVVNATMEAGKEYKKAGRR